jgi:hypothetical protein
MHRKGHRTATIPLAPRTATSLDLYFGERTSGPIFLDADGTRRLDRHAAARIVRRLAKAAGIDKRISPHSLRHRFIPAALDDGVPLRDVQEAASDADPRTTMRTTKAEGHSTGTPPTSSPPWSPVPADDDHLRRSAQAADVTFVAAGYGRVRSCCGVVITERPPMSRTAARLRPRFGGGWGDRGA